VPGHVEHHHDEHKDHHDGARINHDFKRCHKNRTQNIKIHSDGQERNDKVEQRVNRMTLRDGEQRSDDGNNTREIEKRNHGASSRHQAMRVDRRNFVLSLSFILATDCDSGYAPEVVIGILPRTFNLQISFLVYEILPFVLAHLEIRR
jgi:hypothetical protein